MADYRPSLISKSRAEAIELGESQDPSKLALLQIVLKGTSGSLRIPLKLTEGQEKLISSPPFWEFAQENKVSHFVQMLLLNSGYQKCIPIRVREESLRLEEQLRRTVSVLLGLLNANGIDFLVLKTYKGFPSTTQDVDVLVRPESYQLATQALVDAGASTYDARFRGIQQLGLGELDYAIPGLLKIDVYSHIPWRGFSILSEEFLWSSPTYVTIAQSRCPIPSPEADVLALLASNLFTDRKLRLSDLLYFGSLWEKGLNLQKMFFETEKRGWGSAFRNIWSVVERFNKLSVGEETQVAALYPPYSLNFSDMARVLYPVLARNVLARNVPFAIGNILVRSFISPAYLSVRNKLAGFS